MDKLRIEKEVRKLHKEIWDQQDTLWPQGCHSLLDMLNPMAACQLLGIDYQEYPEIDNRFLKGGVRHRIAGLLDRQAQKIAICSSFSLEEVRFTAAHEIGHLILHPHHVMHRDRPLDGGFRQSDPYEREADYFAACFLMPKKSLWLQFQQRFLTIPFHFDDVSSYQIDPHEYNALLLADAGSLDRAFALARCESYNGQAFYSLAKQFKVSKTAMARRIQELGFIQWP